MIISDEIKQRRKEIREQAKTILIGQVLSHPYFPHDIYINMSGIKEWLNQPHKHYIEKNEALLNLPSLLNDSEYLGSVTDPKGRDYIIPVICSKQQSMRIPVGLSLMKRYGANAGYIAYRITSQTQIKNRTSEPFPPELQSDAVF